MAVDFARLTSSLNISKTQTSNNSLYQSILGLINGTRESFDSFTEIIKGVNDSIAKLIKRIANIESTGIIPETIFASLPATPFDGQLANISDGSTQVWGANETTGLGAFKTLLRWNGTNWTVVGI